MAKFLHILAASAGGGLALGAGIRLGAAMCGAAENAGTRWGRRETETGEELTKRLDRVERVAPRTAGFGSALAGVVERMDRQQRDIETMRRQIGDAARALDFAGVGRRELRGEIHWELSSELDRRLAAVEESLHHSLTASNREAVEAMVSSIEKGLAPRIARLENEISGQSASVADRRECALQSERSILRLLTALEKTAGSKPQEDPADPPRLSVVR